MYQHIKVPSAGQKITVNADMSLNVPDHPIIPYIEGDGTGQDITPVMIKVVDAAVAKAGCGSLRNLASAAENKVPLQLEGAGAVVMTTMRQHEADAVAT